MLNLLINQLPNCRFVLISLCLISLSQVKANTDSLWTVWNNSAIEDSVRIDAMSDLAWDGYLFRKPDSAFICAQLAYDLAKKNGLKDKMAVALNTQGASFWVRGIHSKALLYFKRSYELFNE